jgi:hypothetical protein
MKRRPRRNHTPAFKAGLGICCGTPLAYDVIGEMGLVGAHDAQSSSASRLTAGALDS